VPPPTFLLILDTNKTSPTAELWENNELWWFF
jgi:hypothetical protein